MGLLAKGYTKNDIKKHLELNQDKLVQLDPKTIKKVIEELDDLPLDLAEDLSKELPEIKSYIKQKG